MQIRIRQRARQRQRQELAEGEGLAGVLQVISTAAIHEVAAAFARPGQRQRKLPVSRLLLLVVAMSIYTQDALEVVFLRLMAGLRDLAPTTAVGIISKSALCQGRARLGVRPVAALFHQVCRPLATAKTPGAFLFGLRVVAMDGTTDVVPDTPANVRAFGRTHAYRGEAAYPRVLGIYLVEVGTHAVFDAGFWPSTTSEHRGGARLLRSVTPEMLLLYDNGYHSYQLTTRVRAQGAHFLGSLPASVRIRHATPLSDGSTWCWLCPTDPVRCRAGEHLLVRVISYRLTDPARPHHGTVRRLVTSLLDPQEYPAADLVCAYHERWEVEGTIDELASHQRLGQRPLRSQTPTGVLQELYGLLLVHYALRALMLQAAATRGLDPDRISFTRTVHLVAAAVPLFQLASPAQHRRLAARLLYAIARRLLPPRANRSAPRVIKRVQARFPKKRPQHRGIPPLRLPFRDAFALLPHPSSTPLRPVYAHAVALI